ncbi:hypothetical protein RJ640_003245 [Escallonia rubra]|uniref:Xyloglucan endotransglucosylase/hydrolase n=1 Tax=Escallonia rubra TaxID=112253 RepID=A0AA88RGF6_9ASTE|nr:hypothetical protein RJ640_003245 [Escallonia rubra]
MAPVSAMLLPFMLVTHLLLATSAANFYQNVDMTWGGKRGKILNGGQLLTLSLDKASGSGFQSKNEYLFARIDIQLKLVPDNSVGTVTTFYLSSQGLRHDEIDFEFLGNSSGNPYTVHTNVLPKGKSQPMRMYSSLWNADDWATQGGRMKADWTKAPFTASDRNFNANGCVKSSAESMYGSTSTNSLNAQAWQTQELDSAGRNRLRWVQRKFMIYNYCTDLKRFPQGLLAECRRSRFL